MQLIILLALILLAVLGGPWLLLQFMPDATEAILASTAAGSVFGLWLVIYSLCAMLRSWRRRNTTETLERRARRLAEMANQRYRSRGQD